MWRGSRGWHAGLGAPGLGAEGVALGLPREGGTGP